MLSPLTDHRLTFGLYGSDRSILRLFKPVSIS